MELPVEYEPLLISLACEKLGVTVSPEQVIAMREDKREWPEIIYEDILDAEYVSNE